MEQSVETFLKVLDPQESSTGGGSASALAGAMAGSLVAMVARLSIGKPYSLSDAFYLTIITQAEALSLALLDGATQDHQAYGAIRHAYELPQGSVEEKDARRKAIRMAYLAATRVPLDNAEHCGRLIELGRQLKPHANRSAASDLECAILLARAGLLGCLENVQINLPSIQDRQLSAEFAQRRQALINRLESASRPTPPSTAQPETD